jgi:hypothetical protein
MAGPATTADPNVVNINARNMVLNNAINMWQQIYSGVVAAPVPGAVVNIPLRNVGLIKRLVVEITANLTQGAAETQTRTKYGPANTLSNITLTDLSNQTRINTTGWHMHLLATARRQGAFGAAFTNDSPVSIGSNFPVISAPSSFTTVQPMRMFYEIPLAYGDYDLRGAIFANVVNATMNLQLTVNPNFFVGTGVDATLAAYQSSTAQAGTLTNFTITVYQNYLDQIPMSNQGPILPMLDLSTAYLLNNTAVTGLAVNQDTPIPYANFRNFMSTIAIYDNQALNKGTDVNYWSIQSANYTNILKYDPFMSSLLTREIIGDDFPDGTYYFDHRQKPISTVQYGNMQLIANLSNVAGGASQILVGYEALALINMITRAGSLYGT